MNWRDDRGQSAGPEMMILLVFALAAWGFLAWLGRLGSTSQDIANTAQAAARAASIAPDPASGRAAAGAAVAASGLPTPCAGTPAVADGLDRRRQRHLARWQRHRDVVVHDRQRRAVRHRRPHRLAPATPRPSTRSDREAGDEPCRCAGEPSDDRGLAGIAATIVIVVALAGATLIYDGGRALVAQRQIINVAEAAARTGAATADRYGLQAGPATAAAADHIAAAGVPDSDVVAITVTAERVTVTLRAHRTGVFTSLLGNPTITVTGTGTAVWSYDS